MDNLKKTLDEQKAIQGDKRDEIDKKGAELDELSKKIAELFDKKEKIKDDHWKANFEYREEQDLVMYVSWI